MGVYVLRQLLLVLFLCAHATSASEKTTSSLEGSHEATTEVDHLLETEVQVVTLRFHEVEINLLVAGFIMAVVLAKICKFVRAAKN